MSFFSKVPSPNQTWQRGQKVVSPVEKMIEINPAEKAPLDIYKLIIGSVVPRPIAFVSTVSAAGVGNLAPFSFFNGVCSAPPTLMVSIARKPDGSEKDTLRNINETKQFVVNIVSEWIAEPMVHTAAAFPYGVDEMAKVGLTPIASRLVKPTRVKESPIHFECELSHSLQIGDGRVGSATVIFGTIVFVHVADFVYRDGKIDPAALKPIGRLGGVSYTRVIEQFDMPVPKP